MKAIRFPRRDEVEVVDLPDPSPGAGEVVVAVRASGVCHTDIEVKRGNYGASAFPVVPGHEYAGEIAAIGPGVGGLRVGERVVVDPNIECGACRACARGWAHLCESLGAYGVTADGGFAEKSLVRAASVHPAGEISFAVAALAEPMGCVLNGLSPLEGRVIERAAIFGAGPMGLLMGLVLMRRGAEVTMVDLDPDRLAMAEEQGLRPARAGAPEIAPAQAFDLAVDATGAPSVAGALAGHVANGGAALFFGVCPQDARIEISPFEVFRRQLSLFGTHSLNHNIPAALTAVALIGPQIEKVVSHRLTLEETAEVLAGRSQGPRMKVQMAL